MRDDYEIVKVSVFIVLHTKTHKFAIAVMKYRSTQVQNYNRQLPLCYKCIIIN